MSFWNKNKETIVTETAPTKPVLEWQEVDSSFVEAVAYDDDANDLYVTLSHGSYVYHGVPERVFNEFGDAESKGTYFNSRVKDTYTFTHR